MRRRGELVERSFAHVLDRGGMRRAWLRGRENVHKRYLTHVAGFNLGVLIATISGLVIAVMIGFCTDYFTNDEHRPVQQVAAMSKSGSAITIITGMSYGLISVLPSIIGIVLATLLVVWTNAGIRLAFEGNAGPQFQLLALGLLLIFSALLNGFSNRRYGGAG